MKKLLLSLTLILASMTSVAQEVMKGDANGDVSATAGLNSMIKK